LAYDFNRTRAYLNRDDVSLKDSRVYASELSDLKNWYNSATGEHITVTEMRNSGKTFHEWVERVAEVQEVAKEGFLKQARYNFYENIGSKRGYSAPLDITKDEQVYITNTARIRKNHVAIKDILKKKQINKDDKIKLSLLSQENRLLLEDINGGLSGGIDDYLREEYTTLNKNEKYLERAYKNALDKLKNAKSRLTNKGIVDIYGLNDDDDFNLGLKLYLDYIKGQHKNKSIDVDDISFMNTQTGNTYFNQEVIDMLRNVVECEVTVILKTGEVLRDNFYTFITDSLDVSVVWEIVHAVIHQNRRSGSHSMDSVYKQILKRLLSSPVTRDYIYSILRDDLQNKVAIIHVD
jgi:hypothetical protein